jgi:hypothetical protein
MNIKLKLDRDDLKGLITICIIIRENLHGGEVTDTIYEEELKAFELKLRAKLIMPSKSFNISLQNMTTLILYERFSSVDFMPYERSIYTRILGTIDRSHDNHRHMMMNFMSEVNTLKLEGNKQNKLQ